MRSRMIEFVREFEIKKRGGKVIDWVVEVVSE